MIHTKPSMSLYQGTRGAAAGGFQLDLATHDAHKTASIFLAKAGLDAAAKPYVFVLGNPARGGATDHAAPLGAPQWTKVVQAVLKRQAGVPLAPKDLRSSFITFLMSDENSDEVVKKAVAHAMRHSTAQQASPAYDKERAERTWAAAVQVAGSYAARFK